jgi:argininosuccinate synthase
VSHNNHATSCHISYEGDILEDPWAEPEEDMWRWTVSPEDAPDKAEYVELTYKKGDIVYFGISSSLRCAASLSSVKLSIARCAFSMTVPAGVS